MKYQVSALCTEALETVEIEAKNFSEAIEIYREKWENGGVVGVDYEFKHFTVTDEKQEDHIVKQ